MKSKKGRPRDKAKVVYSPVDNTTVLPYARKDSQGNIYFSWKDEANVWRKKNCGRGPKWYQKYLQFEAEIIYKDPYVTMPGITPPVLKDGFLSQIVENVEEFTVDIDECGEPKISEITPMFRRSEMIKWAKDLLHNDPRKASELFEIPYERLLGISQKKNYTLKEISDSYFQRPEFNINVTKEAKKEINKVKATWARFVKVVKVRTILEIDQSMLTDFRNNLITEYLKKKWSTTWLSGHYERFRRVLNSGIDILPNPEDIIEVRRLSLLVMKIPKSEVKNPPYRIKKEELYKVLSVSTLEEKAMWLLSLNCAYYGVDVANVPLSAIDWDAKTIVFRRSKTGVHRAAMLWEETINAMQNYLESSDKSVNRKTFFVSRTGAPYASDRIRKRFDKVRKAAGLNHITHSHFRDSFNSVAMIAKGIQNSLDAVMGHKPSGSRGDYRDPELVPEIAEEACKVVHDFYFGT